MSQTERTYKTAAYEKGKEAALAAASWCCDGNTPQDHIRRMVKWFDDGDPQYEQYLPQRPNLSGEWEDGLTPTKLAEEILPNYAREEPDLIDEITEAFEEGVADHFEPECERILRAAITEDE